MQLPDVRRLAAADMFGTRGRSWRRRAIRAEFVLGAVGCTALGILTLASGTGWQTVIGIWLVGAGANYVPLALQAQRLARPGELESELRGVDLRNELRRATIGQLWIAVPFALCLAAGPGVVPTPGS